MIEVVDLELEDDQLGQLEWLEWAAKFDETTKRDKLRYKVRALLEEYMHEEIIYQLNEFLVKSALEE